MITYYFKTFFNPFQTINSHRLKFLIDSNLDLFFSYRSSYVPAAVAFAAATAGSSNPRDLHTNVNKNK